MINLNYDPELVSYIIEEQGIYTDDINIVNQQISILKQQAQHQPSKKPTSEDDASYKSVSLRDDSLLVKELVSQQDEHIIKQ